MAKFLTLKLSTFAWETRFTFSDIFISKFGWILEDFYSSGVLLCVQDPQIVIERGFSSSYLVEREREREVFHPLMWSRPSSHNRLLLYIYICLHSSFFLWIFESNYFGPGVLIVLGNSCCYSILPSKLKNVINIINLELWTIILCAEVRLIRRNKTLKKHEYHLVTHIHIGPVELSFHWVNIVRMDVVNYIVCCSI